MWPQGLLARISWIIVAGAAALMIAMHAYYVHERLLASATAFAASVAERLIAIDALLVEDDGAEGRVLRAFATPDLSIRIAAEPPNQVGRAWPHADEVRHAALATLPEARRARTRISFVMDNSARPGRPVLTVALERADSTWLVARGHSIEYDSGWVSLALSWNLLLVVAVLGVMLWLARRSLKQLPRFAAAAEQLGRQAVPDPLPEQRGPREVRRLAVAFNDMQRRIRNYVDERTGMLAAVSHDLRTYLTRLMLRTEFIVDEQQRSRAEGDIEEMITLIDDVITFAREDRNDDAAEQIDIAALLAGVMDEYREIGASISYTGPSNLRVSGRPLALKRALRNLIDNALRYGHRADVALRTSDGRIGIEIGDRGPSIPAEQRGVVLQPFQRIDNSRSRATGGTGLGLAIASTIVARHNGTLELADREGGGLVVRITLPREGG